MLGPTVCLFAFWRSIRRSIPLLYQSIIYKATARGRLHLNANLA